jgi:hypothetical protein
MGTTDPGRRHSPPVVAEDGPWTVGVIKNPHDSSSYTLYVQSAYLLAMEIPLCLVASSFDESYFDSNIFLNLWCLYSWFSLTFLDPASDGGLS